MKTNYVKMFVCTTFMEDEILFFLISNAAGHLNNMSSMRSQGYIIGTISIPNSEVLLP